ncbi:hypothetical protein F5Y04DRAFT_281889 [Hypomontagnella monticulosa]|nr:hypothetical protein F5Y04DRAFT_281889 [Hypomontagnella monticulosa]
MASKEDKEREDDAAWDAIAQLMRIHGHKKHLPWSDYLYRVRNDNVSASFQKTSPPSSGAPTKIPSSKARRSSSPLDPVIIRRSLRLLRNYPGVVTYTNRRYSTIQHLPRNARLPGTIYGMSLLHRSHATSPIENLRMRKRHVKGLRQIIDTFRTYKSRRSGAPKTALEYALVMKACRGHVFAATKLIEQLWYQRHKAEVSRHKLVV